MSDKRLLEKAAKAAGMNLGEIFVFTSAEKWVGWRDQHNTMRGWNPLANDDEALRLAVKLQIDIEWECMQDEASMCAYRRSKEGSYFTALEAPSDYRRAIVRAAASIGEQTK